MDRSLLSALRNSGAWPPSRCCEERHFKPIIAVEQGLTDPVSGLIMGATAEVLVEEFGLSRQEQDGYALESHSRAVAAQGKLAEEIVAGEVHEDFGPRKDQSLEALA